MSLKKLPQINAKAPNGVKWDTHSDAMSKWDSSLISASSDTATITMYDAIGSDGWSEGVTAKRISAALRSIGDRDVTVSLNSPGGDFFEGIAIYNLLREHPFKVTVKVVGLAASAALKHFRYSSTNIFCLLERACAGFASSVISSYPLPRLYQSANPQPRPRRWAGSRQSSQPGSAHRYL